MTEKSPGDQQAGGLPAADRAVQSEPQQLPERERESSVEPAGIQPSWAAQGCFLHPYIPQMHPFFVSKQAQEDRIQSSDKANNVGSLPGSPGTQR